MHIPPSLYASMRFNFLYADRYVFRRGWNYPDSYVPYCMLRYILTGRADFLMDGEKYTVLEALERGKKYAKIYIALGVNELGADAGIYESSFSGFLDQVKALQPQAVIYLETVVPVNPAKCTANRQPYYVTNEKVYAFNEVLPRLAEEKQVVLLDIAGFFSDETGVLAADDTVDGVHFTKGIYQQWLAYLMNHTVDPAEYAAGQTAAPDPAADITQEEGETNP